MKITKEQAIEAIFRKIPYSNQIKELDLSNDREIRFTWRGDRYRVGLDPFHIEIARNGCLIGDEKAILMEYLVKPELVGMLL